MPSKVSVITSVYNGIDYIDRAVPSILSQNLNDFEWIIVDDGSTDGTAEFLAELAERDRRVKVLSPGRLGFVKALNHAIEQAEGEYIARQDFDDVSYAQRLQLQLEYLDAHPEVGVVGCHYVIQDENRQERYVRVIPDDHDELVKLMAKCVPFAHTLVMFRKQAWQQAGGYPSLDDIEDLRLWVTFAKLGWKLGSIGAPLGEHWVHPKSFWHSNFAYARRQRRLANVQLQAIQDLELPMWMRVYPMGRYFYHLLPNRLKAFLRRVVARSQEQDLSTSL